jgi:hypothetical protein
MVTVEWEPIDLDGEPDDDHFDGDPGQLIDAAAFVATIARRPTWHQRAACRGLGTRRWFPTKGQSLDPARIICEKCPATVECEAAALDAGWLVAGVWGGLSPAERQALRRSA